jgi:magnesium chelatase family protein
VEGGDCVCPPNTRRRYLARLSGPLMDRIDIQLRVQRVTAAQLRAAQQSAADGLPGAPGPSARISTGTARARVEQARGAAAERLRQTPWRVNNEVPGEWLRARGRRPAPQAMAALDRALERGGITMRGYDRVLRVAWSIADIEGRAAPAAEQINQALYLRKGM